MLVFQRSLGFLHESGFKMRNKYTIFSCERVHLFVMVKRNQTKEQKHYKRNGPFYIIYFSQFYSILLFFYIILFLPLIFLSFFAPVNDIMHKRKFDSSSSSYLFYIFSFQFLSFFSLYFLGPFFCFLFCWSFFLVCFVLFFLFDLFLVMLDWGC